ncbi:unnamed protein product [Rotaria magnacalcarata]|uniref:AIG1-type G domain-containing protein n=1 Tax=Rotaria magnacalcarata TaxID=392030 RepID=A0A820STW8_9BILA|nr:unnamed protein product [Rotaria magnacalcarata]
MAGTNQTNVLATGALNEVRMILLGKTGAGKSAFGNTILGQERFRHKTWPNVITTECPCAIREFDGKRLFVVDTPGLLDMKLAEEKLHEEIAKSYQMTAMPGPHVFLLVFDITQRYTPEQYESVQLFEGIFGPEAANHTIVVFTHMNDLNQQGKTIEQYLGTLKDESAHLLNKILDKFHERYLGALASVIETEMSRGTYQRYKSDGSFALLPQTKAIVIDGYLRRVST